LLSFWPTHIVNSDARLTRSRQHANEVHQAPRLRTHNDSAIAQHRPCNWVAGLQAQTHAYFTRNRDLALAGDFGWLGHVEIYLYDLDFRNSAGSRGQHKAIMRSASLMKMKYLIAQIYS
jgi:hypothetical protein